jgi:hypothetical protein
MTSWGFDPPPDPLADLDRRVTAIERVLTDLCRLLEERLLDEGEEILPPNYDWRNRFPPGG